MKLKIRSINESKSINEADLNLGYRLKTIEKIEPKIKSAIASKGFKYKSLGEKGFYILPQKASLATVELTRIAPDEEDFSVHVEAGNNNGQAIKVPNKATYDELFGDGSKPGLLANIAEIMLSAVVIPDSFKAISESLNENALLEFGPLSAIKGFFAKNAASKDQKKHTQAMLSDLKNALENGFEDSIKNIAKNARGKSYLKVDSKISSNTLTVSVTCDFILGIVYGANAKDLRQLVVTAIRTPFGDIAVARNVDIFATLTNVGKSIGVDFKLVKDDVKPPEDDAAKDGEKEGDSKDGDPDAAGKDGDSDNAGDKDNTDGDDKKGGESPKPAPVDDDGWRELIGAKAFDVLHGIAPEKPNESISHKRKRLSMLTEAYKLKIPASSYQKALKEVETDDNEKYLMRYFLFNETNGVFTSDEAKKLDYKTALDIADLVKEAGFNPNASPKLLYILNYIKKNKEINNIAMAFSKDLVKVYKNTHTYENLGSIIYSKILFNSSKDTRILAELIDYWYNDSAFSKDTLPNLSDSSKQNLIDKFELPERLLKIPSTKWLDIKKCIMLDPTTNGNSKKFRSVSDIEAISSAISSATSGGSDVDSPRKGQRISVDKAHTGNGVKDPNKVIQKCLDNIDAIDTELLTQLLSVAKDQGSKDREMKGKLAKAVLTAMGKLR